MNSTSIMNNKHTNSLKIILENMWISHLKIVDISKERWEKYFYMTTLIHPSKSWLQGIMKF